MPQYKNPFEKGRLVIKFNVTFPESNWITPDKLKVLEQQLPPRVDVIVPDGAEECTLQEFDPSTQRSRGSQFAAYDSDDEEHGHGQRVQCASH